MTVNEARPREQRPPGGGGGGGRYGGGGYGGRRDGGQRRGGTSHRHCRQTGAAESAISADLRLLPI